MNMLHLVNAIGVSFPDFPGVVTAGTNLDDARAMAEEALSLHIEGLAEDGEAIPEPSSLDDIKSEPDNRSGVAILVSATSARLHAIRVFDPGQRKGSWSLSFKARQARTEVRASPLVAGEDRRQTSLRPMT